MFKLLRCLFNRKVFLVARYVSNSEVIEVNYWVYNDWHKKNRFTCNDYTLFKKAVREKESHIVDTKFLN